MQFTAAQISQLIGGTIIGDATTIVEGFGKIESAKSGELTFFANPKYEAYLYSTKASIIIINKNFELAQPITATLIQVDDAYQSLAQLMQIYQDITQKNNAPIGIEQPSHIEESASIGFDVYIGAFAYIGKNVSIGNHVKIYPNVYIGDNTIIGDNTTIYPNAIIYNQSKIGQHVIIHGGCVIGSDGFGFAPQKDGTYKKVPQLGNVIIEDHVEIGSNTTIDRATMGATIIKAGAKLDNLIQIAHNVEIGHHTVIAAQTGISGSTKLGNNCLVGGQVGIVGHIQLADGTKINAQSGVAKGIKEPNQAITGSPAFEYRQALKSQSVFKKLPEILERLELLEQQLADFQAKNV